MEEFEYSWKRKKYVLIYLNIFRKYKDFVNRNVEGIFFVDS